MDRPSTAFDVASWTEANAAAVAWTGLGAAADLGALTETATAAVTLTATDGVIPRETGCVMGTTVGAAREGVNDNDRDGNEEGVVPKAGIPDCEGLELAPAAPDIPDAEGTDK